ncbi:unnamed protein product [Chondrus crispus]|uniref:Uncharacterized protein n=1 Tax=Chondrus crispus TaxID=2769 RepID=R7Q4R2_CHOCR|nr:unnamed protein product [Chondrus crispus]CDF32979.1 unnamed protein product [Chondrus crispus]|eukprot:XP_005712782.1 unnamed protein product [Chondrus crispus]
MGSIGPRVRFDAAAAGSPSTMRHVRTGRRSLRELHRGRRSEDPNKHDAGRRIKAVAGRILAGGHDGRDIPLTVRRAKSGGWCDVKCGETEKKKKKSGSGIALHRNDSKSDWERVEEMCKLASECSGSSGSASFRSVWHSLIAIENEI